METVTINLAPEDIERIAVRTAQLLRTAPTVTEEILTRREAMAYVKRRSFSAFERWTGRWGVRPDTRGRWSRSRLDLALAREAGQVHVPVALRQRREVAA